MNFQKGARILVVAAHPDDEVLGCGGTLLKAISLGAEVMVQFMGEGVSARFPYGDYDNEDFINQTRVRTEGALKALGMLGIREYLFGERLCCQFDKYPILSLVKDIEQAVTHFRPDIVLTHNPIEVNIDHRITYEAVEVACRPARESSPSQIYTFEIPCSGSWSFQSAFKPNVFVDISDFWDQKLLAWASYEGESRPFPFPRSVEGLRTLAQYRGMMSGLRLAEAFRVARMTF